MKKITAKVLVLGTIMLSCGASFMWPINTIFIHNYLHKSLAVAGIVLFFNSLCNFIGNYIGGKMFDRLGGHKTAMINASIALIALMGLIINHNWPAFPIFLSMLGFGIGGTYTVINSSAAFIGGVDRYKVFNNIYMGSKIGSLIGTAICSVIVGIQISLVFVADFICVLGFLVMAYFLYNNPAKIGKKEPAKKVSFKWKLTPGIGWIILFLNLTWIVNSQWGSNISTHLTDIGVPVGKYSFLWTINSLIVIVFLPVLNHFAGKRDWFKKIQVALGVVLFIVALGSLVGSTHYLSYAAGMVFLILGEMLVYPTVAALVSETTPKSESGLYQSIVSMSENFPKAIGPFLGGVLIEKSSYNTMFLLAMIMLVRALFVLWQAYRKLVWDRKELVD